MTLEELCLKASIQFKSSQGHNILPWREELSLKENSDISSLKINLTRFWNSWPILKGREKRMALFLSTKTLVKKIFLVGEQIRENEIQTLGWSFFLSLGLTLNKYWVRQLRKNWIPSVKFFLNEEKKHQQLLCIGVALQQAILQPTGERRCRQMELGRDTGLLVLLAWLNKIN